MDQTDPTQVIHHSYIPICTSVTIPYLPPEEFDLEEYKNRTIDEHKELIEENYSNVCELSDPLAFMHFEEESTLDKKSGLFTIGVDATLWKSENKYFFVSTFERFTTVGKFIPSTDPRVEYLETNTYKDEICRDGLVEFNHGKNKSVVKDLEKWICANKEKKWKEINDAYDSILSYKVNGVYVDPRWQTRKDVRNPLLFLSFCSFKKYSNQIITGMYPAHIGDPDLDKYLVI